MNSTTLLFLAFGIALIVFGLLTMLVRKNSKSTSQLALSNNGLSFQYILNAVGFKKHGFSFMLMFVGILTAGYGLLFQ